MLPHFADFLFLDDLLAVLHDRIFGELYRVEQTAHLQGVGLGLTIVARLLELLHGAIRVHSELGQGSRFEVTLPCIYTASD